MKIYEKINKSFIKTPKTKNLKNKIRYTLKAVVIYEPFTNLRFISFEKSNFFLKYFILILMTNF